MSLTNSAKVSFGLFALTRKTTVSPGPHRGVLRFSERFAAEPMLTGPNVAAGLVPEADEVFTDCCPR